MIFIAGITIAVFIEFLLISKKEKSDGDIILALWIFSITVHLFLFYLYFADELFSYSFLLGIEMPLPLLQGVFLYWYVGSVTDQLPANRRVIALHFLPAIFTYVYLISFFILPAEQKVQIYKSHGAGYEIFNTVRFVAIVLSGIVYIGWSGALLTRHKRRILSQFSYQDKIDLQWLRILTTGLGGIWLLILVSDEILFAGVAVFVFLIGFFGIRQARIFKHRAGEAEPQKEKYSKSGLTKELSDKLYASLIALMNKDALYRKDDLSIGDLASRLEVHPNYLSQVINEREKKNFYDFVNHYRIEEFKKLMSDPKNRNLTLLAVAFECGFNSKSSFNRYFKKTIGQTPSEYFTALPKP
jgi:AraC-like DNA-binding protein